MLNELLACPFCGKHADMDDPDTLHPTGTGWADDIDAFRVYVSYRKVPQDQWCWGVHCPTSAGGCGAEITGDSRDEAIAKWNRRANAKVSGAGTASAGLPGSAAGNNEAP